MPTSMAHLLSEKCIVQRIENACLLYSTDELFGQVTFNLLFDFLLSVLVYSGPVILGLAVYKAKVVSIVLAKYCANSTCRGFVASVGLYGVFAMGFHSMISIMFFQVTLPLVLMCLEVFMPLSEVSEIYDGFLALLPNWIDAHAKSPLEGVLDAIRTH